MFLKATTTCKKYFVTTVFLKKERLSAIQKIISLVESIYKLQIGKFMYQYRPDLLPDSFNNMFLVTHQVHSYGTRSSEFFHLPQCRTNMRKFPISFQGPKFFNSLSSEILNATSTASFCCKLKAFLLS